MSSRGRQPSRSRTPSPRRSRDYDRERRSPPRNERSRGGYQNGDRGDRYRDSGRSRYDDNRGSRRGGRHNENRENPRPSNCLGIFGMSMNTSERDLREIFESYGRVSSVKIIMDRSTDRSRGFGFINFEERADAIKAREKIADTVIDGMKVRVDYAIENRRTSPAPRARSPIRSSRRYSRSPVRRQSRDP